MMILITSEKGGEMEKEIRIKMRLYNNLILKRAEEIHGEGLSFHALSKKVGVSYGVFLGYLGFKASPVRIYKKKDGPEIWSWRESAERLAKNLACRPDEIFPEEFWRPRENKHELELALPDLEALAAGHQPLLPDEAYAQTELRDQIRKSLAQLRAREAEVLGYRYLQDLSLRQISEILDLSPERIRQIEHKALRRLRHPKRSKDLAKHRRRRLVEKSCRGCGAIILQEAEDYPICRVCDETLEKGF